MPGSRCQPSVLSGRYPDVSPLADKIGMTKLARDNSGVVSSGGGSFFEWASSTHTPEKLKLLKASMTGGQDS